MDVSDQAYERFTGLLYESLETPETWHTFYEELSEAIEADSIHVLALDKQHGTLSYSDGANLQVRGELAYMQKYRFIDPRLPLVLNRPLLEWVHCHEALSEDFVARDPFYQEFLLPLDRRYLTACKLVDNEAATVIFATLCSPSRGPLPKQSVDFLTRLLPHLSRACRLSVKNFVYSTQALIGHMLVNKLRQPVILMSPHGDIVKTNEAAERLLRSSRLVAVRDSKLWLPPEYQEELLRKCAEMEGSIKKGDDVVYRPGGQFHSMQIKSAAGSKVADETLYAFFSMLAPQEVMGTFGLRPMIMMFFYHPGSAPTIDPNLLFAAFGLTPAECRVASLLAEGISLKQIATLQGTQHETVRKQLRSIYQKTATNRQPELIRLLLHLPTHILEDAA